MMRKLNPFNTEKQKVEDYIQKFTEDMTRASSEANTTHRTIAVQLLSIAGLFLTISSLAITAGNTGIQGSVLAIWLFVTSLFLIFFSMIAGIIDLLRTANFYQYHAQRRHEILAKKHAELQNTKRSPSADELIADIHKLTKEIPPSAPKVWRNIQLSLLFFGGYLYILTVVVVFLGE